MQIESREADIDCSNADRADDAYFGNKILTTDNTRTKTTQMTFRIEIDGIRRRCRAAKTQRQSGHVLPNANLSWK